MIRTEGKCTKIWGKIWYSILPYSSLWSIRFESSKYRIWQLVVSQLYEGMRFQLWYKIWMKKKLNNIFSYIFFWSLKFCTFWYIIQLVNTVDHFVDQRLNFSFSNVQISNDILLVSLIITEYNPECHQIIVHFKSHDYFQKMWKCHFFERIFFSGVSRFTNFYF